MGPVPVPARPRRVLNPLRPSSAPCAGGGGPSDEVRRLPGSMELSGGDAQTRGDIMAAMTVGLDAGSSPSRKRPLLARTRTWCALCLAAALVAVAPVAAGGAGSAVGTSITSVLVTGDG